MLVTVGKADPFRPMSLQKGKDGVPGGMTGASGSDFSVTPAAEEK